MPFPPMPYHRAVIVVHTDTQDVQHPGLRLVEYDTWDDCTVRELDNGEIAVIRSDGTEARRYDQSSDRRWGRWFVVDDTTTEVQLLPLFADQVKLVSQALDFYAERINEMRSAPNFSKSDNWGEEAAAVSAASEALSNPFAPTAHPWVWHRVRIALQLMWANDPFEGDQLTTFQRLDALLAPYSPPE